MLLFGRYHLAALLLVAAANAATAADDTAKPALDNRTAVEFFETKIRPALVKYCYECHSEKSASLKGGLRLDTRAGIRQGGDSGPAVVPGKIDESLLLDAIRFDGLEMPPNGKVPALVIADFEKWIRLGAADPREGDAAPRTSRIDFKQGLKFWAFQPPTSSPLPDVSQHEWPKQDPDRFVLAKLEQKKLRPSPAADRRTLIRRATFDLIGLPPTPAEVAAFLADESSEAFERVIDRLLASPHYGERWGRHWLDVARYAEDQAHTFKARKYPRGYLYRDWVVNALNQDMPYDKFLKSQIAGDLLPQPNKHERMPALGFFALGPVYYQDNGEKAKALADEWDDRVDTLARGVLGLTVACARCHDHKFDPISMQDYYGLAGIFASSVYQERPAVPDNVVSSKRQAEGMAKDQQLAIDRFLAAESRQVRPHLAAQISKYVVAAWKLHNKQKANRKNKKLPKQVARQEKVSEFLLSRWARYLFSKPAANDHPWLADWRKLIDGQDPKRDLSGNKELVAAVEQAAAQLQTEATETIARRKELFAAFGENIAFVEEAHFSKVVPGVIPLGNLFDDSVGTSLDAAVASDRFKASANSNSLGVDRVAAGWGRTTTIAPGIRFDFTHLGSDNSAYGKVTNDGWNDSGGIRTTGKRVGGNAGRMEQGIGMHANALVTFDLDEIRKAGLLPVDQKFRFRVDRAGLNDDVAGNGVCSVHLAVIVAAQPQQNDTYDAIIAGYVNGQQVKVNENDRTYYFGGQIPAPVKADGKFVSFEVPIPPAAKFLTLVTTGAATDKDDNTINSDHAVFSSVRLEQDPLPAPIAAKDETTEKRKPTNAADKADAFFLSRLLHDEGLLAISAAESAAFLQGDLQKQLAAMNKELNRRKKEAAAIQVTMAHALTEGNGTHLQVFKQGDPTKKGDEAPRSIPAVLTKGNRNSFDTKGSGRLELAQAIASANNPLTARVIVNRVWQRHFGFGLVRTPSNFGALGERPSHPKLLDNLALSFIKSGWSLKSLHRQLMLSATYQQSSQFDADAFDVDPDNRLLWRMNRQRLEVEPWRDAMLAVSGQLDRTQGGPSINLASAGNRRRTLYGFISRHKLDELLRLFDFPDPNITSDTRSITTVPLQQLFVLNSEFTIAQARAFAARLMSETPGDDKANPDRIRHAYQVLYSRTPSEAELKFGITFLAATTQDKQKQDRLSAWEQYALALLGANEFTYID